MTLTCMIASRIFVKLKSKVESRIISCKILPISCLAAMSKNRNAHVNFKNSGEPSSILSNLVG